MCVLVILMICHICVYGIYFHPLFDTVCLLGLEAVVVVIGGNWIYNYLCNQCLSPLKLWVRLSLRRGVLDTTLSDKVCQWLAAGRWFSPGTPVFLTSKTDHHDITEILNTTTLTSVCLLHTIRLRTRGFNSSKFLSCHCKKYWLVLFCLMYTRLKPKLVFGIMKSSIID